MPFAGENGRHLLCSVSTMGKDSEPATNPETTERKLSIDEFRKLELRVGTVISAEPHPNADRLLVLKVNLGSEERQLVAGIRAHYEPEALVGRQLVVVANLEPAKLRGIESQGMILAASADDALAFITPERPITAGAKVS